MNSLKNSKETACNINTNLDKPKPISCKVQLNQVTRCKDHLDKQWRGEAGSWCRSGSAMLNETKNQLQG